MDHYDAAMPGRILRVVHEELLDDPEGQVRRMLDYLGVPFDLSKVLFIATANQLDTIPGPLRVPSHRLRFHRRKSGRAYRRRRHQPLQTPRSRLIVR